jgi:hypothetical protein
LVKGTQQGSAGPAPGPVGSHSSRWWGAAPGPSESLSGLSPTRTVSEPQAEGPGLGAGDLSVCRRARPRGGLYAGLGRATAAIAGAAGGRASKSDSERSERRGRWWRSPAAREQSPRQVESLGAIASSCGGRRARPGGLGERSRCQPEPRSASDPGLARGPGATRRECWRTRSITASESSRAFLPAAGRGLAVGPACRAASEDAVHMIMIAANRHYEETFPSPLNM